MTKKEKHFVVMVLEWAPYADGEGAWLWRLFTSSVMPESSLQVVLDGLEAAGKVFAYGEVQGCTCGTCLAGE